MGFDPQNLFLPTEKTLGHIDSLTNFPLEDPHNNFVDPSTNFGGPNNKMLLLPDITFASLLATELFGHKLFD